MATYVIGDLQGCFDEFTCLLDKIDFSFTDDTLYLVGDLIGRGPKSLETLAFITQHPNAIKTVLGNHDLHFLAIANGIKKAKVSDRFEPLLQSRDLEKYVHYLRQQPLLIDIPEHSAIITHAGISPQWDLADAKSTALNVSNVLRSDDYCDLLRAMYRGNNNDWHQADTPLKKMIFAINSMTRMRYCHQDGTLDFNQKCRPDSSTNPNLIPWYQLTTKLPDAYMAIFGHWASLMGCTNSSQFVALDTGCLWGNYLSAFQIENQYITIQTALI